MANRFWVGGTNTWDATVGTKWATTSGGAGGASIPTATDDAIFDGSSGSGVVTLSTGYNADCKNLTCTGFTGTLAGSNQLRISGSMTLAAGMTLSYTGLIVFTSTSSGQTITTAGKTISSYLSFGDGGAGGVWTSQDAMTTTNQLVFDNGTFNSNNQTISCSSVSLNGGVLTMGSSTWTITSSTGFVATAGTLNTNTSTINLTNTGSTNFAGNGFTYNSVNFSGGATISGANTFTTLTFSATSGSKNVSFTGTQTASITFNGVGGTWVLQTSLNNGTSSITLTNGSLNTNNQTVTCGTFALSNANVRTLTLGASTINCTAWTATTTTNLTFSAASSTINQTGNTFAGGGLTYGVVVLMGTVTVSGANTFGTLTLSPSSVVSLTISIIQSVTSAFNMLGALGSLVTLQSTSAGTPATISSAAATLNVRYARIIDSTGSGGAKFVANTSINGGGNTGWTFSGPTPSFNTSVITAVARIQQGFSVPRFIMGGKGGSGGTTYQLFKQGTSYLLHIWRSKPFIIGRPFSFSSMTLQLSAPVATGMLIVPVLRFDDGLNVVYGNNIDTVHYPNGEIFITLTSDSFAGQTVGKKNLSIEFDFQGTALLGIELPINIVLETIDISTSA